ncbi:DNA-directed RNA polymerase I RPA43 [Besnoitia besnoiti]|uniref:DNA-directed RNA polymerase I RPA43 n=1 Tax=Besnoitia besnoiti TaxID=94643 RepID=A0A2A9MQH2_BESBE|nr:DNA-directed RNA polymerase I RPA43 [Besnoitia besnoiti]PFH38290.1 DNA-directed RNA polymerase I RPA43 [Besnoitia besnoiti]
MAQVPWEKLSQRPVSEAEAGEFLSRCLFQLRRCSLSSASDGTGVDGALIQQSEVVRQLRSVHAAVSQSQRLFSSRSAQPRASGETTTARDSEASFKDLADLRRSVFHVIKAKGMIQLLPRHLGNAKLGINLYLLNFLLKYLPEFHGVWLAVDGFRVLQPKSAHGSSACPLGYMIPDVDTGGGVMLFEIEVNCLVFKPKTNAMLIGRLQTVRPSHVRLLWLGLFSAVVPRHRLSRAYEIDQEQKKLIQQKGGAAIEQGDLVCFQLMSYTQGSRAELVSLEGSLESAYAGLVVSTKSEEAEKKKKKTHGARRGSEEEPAEGSESPNAKKKQTSHDEDRDRDAAPEEGKKKKRRKHEEENEDEGNAAAGEKASEPGRDGHDESDGEEEEKSKKKKKKRRDDDRETEEEEAASSKPEADEEGEVGEKKKKKERARKSHSHQEEETSPAAAHWRKDKQAGGEGVKRKAKHESREEADRAHVGKRKEEREDTGPADASPEHRKKKRK